MQFLYFLEKVRVGFLDEIMLCVTQFGEETAFLVLALIIFWCVDKRQGYYVLATGFIGTIANQFMKLWFRIPRPWVIDEKFTILEQAREAASGYSFPSGHTQSAVGTFGALAYSTKKKWIRIASIIIAVLVPFSRMYIGVHTPMDVFVSAAIAVLLIVVLKPLVLDNPSKTMPWVLGFMLLIGIGFLCFVHTYQFPSDIDVHNLESGFKNAYTLSGAMIGLLIVYIVDEKWLKFSTAAVWWIQIIKVVGGLAVVLAVKAGLKTPLNTLFGELPGRAVRYGLIVLVAGVLWPSLFKLLNRLHCKGK